MIVSPRPAPPISDAITTMLSAIMIVWLTASMSVRRASGSWTLPSTCICVAPIESAASTEFLGTPRMPSAVMRTAGGIA